MQPFLRRPSSWRLLSVLVLAACFNSPVVDCLIVTVDGKINTRNQRTVRPLTSINVSQAIKQDVTRCWQRWGYDNIDLKACESKSVVAMNTPGQNANAVAELVFGMMLGQGRYFRGFNMSLVEAYVVLLAEDIPRLPSGMHQRSPKSPFATSYIIDYNR